MDAQAKKKAFYRAKLKAQNQEKRIESPLVRYNDNDQPICRVCEVILKSESSWQAHQVSAKHREAVKNLKANAAAANRVTDLKRQSSAELSKPKPELSIEPSHRPEPSRAQTSSALPPDFFDKNETKRPKVGNDDSKSNGPDSRRKVLHSAQKPVDAFDVEKKNGISSAIVGETTIDETRPSSTDAREVKTIAVSETNQVKGALPEGFFDDKNADLRARGITPVKLDIKDEYKEFEKLIQEDLKEVDNRLEEEEYDAAEMIEEAESVEQKTCKERVAMFKRKKMELKTARAAMNSKVTQKMEKESGSDESSSDNDSDDNFTVDWRAKHL